MKDESKIWLSYANENYQSAKILLNSHLYNPTLQNIQQAIEKYLKAIFIENNSKLQRNHNISTLIKILLDNNINLTISDDEIDLIDSIYLTSKYPFGSVLADFEADENICNTCLNISNKIKLDVETYFKVTN